MKWWGGTLGTVLVIALLVLSPSAGAATTIVVNTNADSGPTSSECSGVAGDCSLRQAIDRASSSGGDTIVVPSDTYTLTSGPLMVSKSVTITGNSASNTVISGNNTSQVFVFTGTGNVTMSNVTVTGGLERVPNGTARGGGISTEPGTTLTLDAVIVTGNVADASGGSNQQGGTAQGGGIYAAGSLAVKDSVISGNESKSVGASGKAGGLSQGGGIFDNASSSGSLSLNDVALDSNVADASGGAGGAGDIAEGGSLENNNTSAPMTLTNVTISHSTAVADGSGTANGGVGGAGGVEVRSGATLTNVTIAENSSAADATGTGDGGSVNGGGLLAYAPTTLLNTTVSANHISATGTAGTAGGGNLYGYSAITAENSIVAAGQAQGANDNCGGTLTSVGHNIDSLDQCGFHGPGDQTSTNPKLGPLQFNGGPLETDALLAGSPAIHAANAADCPATDARGVARPAGACDVGAYQSAPPTVTTSPASDITQTGATANGTINPNAQDTSYYFEYGTSTHYGQSTAAADAGNATLSGPVSIDLAGLAPNTTYHYALVASNADGTSVGSDQTFTTLPAPAVRVRIKPSSFATAHHRHHHAKVGSRITFTLNTPALVIFGIQMREPGRLGAHGKCIAPSHGNRHRRACVRWVTLHGDFTTAGQTGTTSFKFSGRWAGKRLAPGTYRLAAIPVAGGITGTGALTDFRIVL